MWNYQINTYSNCIHEKNVLMKQMLEGYFPYDIIAIVIRLGDSKLRWVSFSNQAVGFRTCVMKGSSMKYDTKILHGGVDRDPYTGALSIPIYPASTYHQKNIDERQEFDYSRSGNPTRKALEGTLASLESGEAGFAFSSGVAAITAAITCVCKSGDHLVVTKDIYGGTYKLLTRYLNKLGIDFTFADTTSIEATESSIGQNTKALYLESPSNPLLKIVDFRGMIALAKKHNILVMADNTFLSPYFFRPIELGADISIHSATKFLGGHSDLIAGAVVTKTKELGEDIRFVQNTTGNMLSPENSWLLMRGIKTLGVRMKAQAVSAFRIAQWLTGQSWVKHVYYPGLPDHPGHDIIASQASGYGAIVSFEAGSVRIARTIMRGVKIWTVAVSLGGVESIMSYPAKMSHASIPKAERDALGITDSLIRLSVGLEDADDLIEDMEQAVR
jgi:cystathionine beta-lyase/cystathionine gamma-synthase